MACMRDMLLMRSAELIRVTRCLLLVSSTLLFVQYPAATSTNVSEVLNYCNEVTCTSVAVALDSVHTAVATLMSVADAAALAAVLQVRVLQQLLILNSTTALQP
jgi:hypothetical protein